MKYYCNGKRYYESSKSKKEADAKRLLEKKEGEISERNLLGIYFDRIRFDELTEDFLANYSIDKKKSLARAARSTRHFKVYSGGFKVS